MFLRQFQKKKLCGRVAFYFFEQKAIKWCIRVISGNFFDLVFAPANKQTRRWQMTADLNWQFTMYRWFFNMNTGNAKQFLMRGDWRWRGRCLRNLLLIFWAYLYAQKIFKMLTLYMTPLLLNKWHNYILILLQSLQWLVDTLTCNMLISVQALYAYDISNKLSILCSLHGN